MNISRETLEKLADKARDTTEGYSDSETPSAAYWAGVEDALRYVLGGAAAPKGL